MFTEDDIRHAVPPNTFAAAQYYARQGRVRAVAPTSASHIEAEVVGSAKRPYVQSITLKKKANGTHGITSTCTCPVGRNCKHVAAALLIHLQDPKPIPATAKPTRAKPGATRAAEASLPHEIAAWLNAVEAAQEPESEDYPPTIRKRLLYVLVLGPNGEPRIELQTVQLSRDGEATTTGRPQSPSTLANAPSPPKYLRPSDKALIRRLPSTGPRTPEFPGLLREILATGRARLDAWHGFVLRDGGPVHAPLAWAPLPGGHQRPTIDLPRPLRALALNVPWYINPDNGLVGPVDTGLSERLAAIVLASPSLPPALAERVRAELLRRTPTLAIPAPKAYAPAKPGRATLQPSLTLLRAMLPTGPTPLARLEFRYGPISILHTDPSRIIDHEGALIEITRDPAAERTARITLHQLGLITLSSYGRASSTHGSDFTLDDEDSLTWPAIIQHELPQLEKAGWHVTVAPDFPVRLVRPDGDIWARIDEPSGLDWLELDMGVMVDGQRVDLIPAIIKMIAQGSDLDADPEDAPDILVPLPDGRHLILPRARLEPIIEPLLDLFADGELAPNAGTLRVNRHEAAALASLEAVDAGIVWSGGDAVRALGRQLRDHAGIPVITPPTTLEATLRAYQLQGVAWLQFLREAGLGGILADDMGLGKTLQALTHLAVEQEAGRLKGPALVICPTSLVANWAAEAARFTPTLRTLTLHGADRAARFPLIAEHDLVITTYPLLSRDHAILVAQDWHIVLLDEAQIIKNPAATTSKLARTLRADQRLCLSGTPLENHLGELWSLFDFLMPGFLGDRKGFATRYRTPIEKAGDAETQAALARRVAPFLLRRTKAQVAADLPPKTEIPELVQMDAPQRAVYESIRLAMHAKIREAIEERGLSRSGIVILDALLKLRQVCCDPRLLPIKTAKAGKARSAKLDRLMEMLPTLLEEGRRILLFSQFTSMLSLIEAELRTINQPYVILTGETKDRATPIRQFQTNQVPLFLISLKAGGVGLNLTAADTVIHFDPWWNPAVENQATDRAHRIGQDKPVFVHRMITESTIEQKMEILKARKQAMADGILANTAEAATTLTEQDLEVLFAPA